MTEIKKILGSEKFHKTLFENAVDPIVILDKKGRFIEINKKVEKILGYKRKNLIGKKFTEAGILTKKSEMIAFKNFIKRMAGLNIKPYDVEVIKKNGKIIIGEINAASIKKDGEIIGDMVIIRDITEREKSKETLQDVKEKWFSLIENTDDIIMIVDTEGKIQYINKTVPPYTIKETVGKEVYDYVPRNQHDIIRESFKKVFETGNPDSYEVSSNIPKTGIIWFSTKVIPIKHYSEITSLILISTNITERKKTEEELTKLNQELQSKVEELERFTKLSVGRELRMIELKKRIKELEGKLKKMK